MMKYLKSFNETQSWVNDLKSKIDNYLAYLLDDGFITEYFETDDSEEYEVHQIDISKELSYIDNRWHFNYFRWEDIKDYIIPMLITINEEYEISSVKFNLAEDLIDGSNWTKYKSNRLNALFNDNVPELNQIDLIAITLNFKENGIN